MVHVAHEPAPEAVLLGDIERDMADLVPGVAAFGVPEVGDARHKAFAKMIQDIGKLQNVDIKATYLTKLALFLEDLPVGAASFKDSICSAIRSAERWSPEAHASHSNNGSSDGYDRNRQLEEVSANINALSCLLGSEPDGIWMVGKAIVTDITALSNADDQYAMCAELLEALLPLTAKNPRLNAEIQQYLAEQLPDVMARVMQVQVKAESASSDATVAGADGASSIEVMQGLSVRMHALARDLQGNDKSDDVLRASCTGILTVIQQLEPKDRVMMLDAFLQYLMTAVVGGRKVLLAECIGVVSRATDPACGSVADPFFERVNNDFDAFFADVNSKTLAQFKPGYLQSRCDGFVREIALDGGAGKDRALNELARRLMLVQAKHQDALMQHEVGKLLSIEPLASASAGTYAERLYPAARPAEVPDSAETKVAPSNESMPAETRRHILNGQIDAFLERIRATTFLEKQWGENGMEFAGKVLPALINEIISGAADENKPRLERLVSQVAFLKRLDDGLKEIESTLPPVAMKAAVSQARGFFIKEYAADIDTLLSLQVDFVLKYGGSMTDEMRNTFTTNLVKTIRANAAEVDSLMQRLFLGLLEKSQVAADAVWTSQLMSLI